MRLMDATFALLGTNRERVAMAIHVSRGTIVQWSFELGKSPRAAVVRRLVIAHLDALAEEQLHGALAEERP